MKRIRLSVFRSNKYLYAQLIDGGKTLACVEKAVDPVKAGTEIAEKGLKLKIKEVFLDRGRFRYHGNIKKLADAAREKGLVF